MTVLRSSILCKVDVYITQLVEGRGGEGRGEGKGGVGRGGKRETTETYIGR